MGETVAEVATSDLPGFPASTVPGHAGSVRSIATPGGRKVLAFVGRVHGYEGNDPATVVHAVRTAHAAGCTVVVLTNAAGGIREGLAVGQPVLVADHLNLTGVSPVAGPAPPEGLPGRFVDLTDAYALRLRALAREVDPSLAEGVYAGPARAALRDAGRDPHAPHPRRRPGRHVHGVGGHRRPPPGRRGAGAVAGHQPGRRAGRRAARPRGGPRGRPAVGRADGRPCWPRWSPGCERPHRPPRRRRPDRPHGGRDRRRGAGLAGRGPRPGDPGGGRSPARRRPAAGRPTWPRWPTGSAPACSSAPPACGARWGPGPTA